MPATLSSGRGHFAPAVSLLAERSVLVVDDENGIRDLMSRWLDAGGYSVSSASGAEEALGIMETSPPAVAVCDIRMPGHDGLWLVERIRQQHPDTAVIMATGVHDTGGVATLQSGVVDYLTKPFGRDRFRDAVVRGVEWHRTARDARRWCEQLEAEVDVRYERLVDTIAGLTLDGEDPSDRLLAILMSREPDWQAHARRVSALAVAVAGAMRVPEHGIAVIRQGGLLHDMGKLAMPEALLRKPAPLTPDELAIMRRHPALGGALIGGVPGLSSAAGVVRESQERPDGLGYPAGLVMPELSVAGRIVAVADAFDAMTERRVYRDALSTADALLELDRCSGTRFDVHVVGVLRTLVAGQ